MKLKYKKTAYVWFLSFVILTISFRGFAQVFYIAPNGSDVNPGTTEMPFATLEMARDQIRKSGKTGPFTVILKDGQYFFNQSFRLKPEHSGSINKPIVYRAEHEGGASVSGARPIDKLVWKKDKNGLYKTIVPERVIRDNKFDELWLDDIKLSMARFPNADSNAHVFEGVTSFDILNERAKKYKNPSTGFVHGLQRFEWGSVHYRITGFDKGELKLEGGWQQNRDQVFKNDAVMIENVFEELDSPGEWFMDKKTRTLYIIPPPKVDITKASLLSVNLKNLIVYQGSETNPVKFVDFDGIKFQHANRFFLESYEPLLRGDWSVNRSGAILMTGTENCKISNCHFYALGGNGVFFNNYNKFSSVSDSYFERLGESAVCFVGNYAATRSNPIGYDNSYSYDTLDQTPGPKGHNFPSQCKMEGCLVYAIGRLGKQTAGAFISMSEQITVRHNTIYHVPRSGITINDGSWGGHVIEYNHIFNSVIETGDHGPFNSWGRDRYWLTRHHGGDKGNENGALKYSKLDNHLTTFIRNNRFEHGDGFSWGIDLDDGTSNYHLYNNLLLGCSFKLREGFYRIVENNISIGPNPPGKHVSFRSNQDIIRNNIHVATDPSGVVYRGIIGKPTELKEMDYNLYHATQSVPVIRNDGSSSDIYKTTMTVDEWRAAGLDQHSFVGDPLFIDPLNYDFRVEKESPAMVLGFKNFRMDNFGVTKAAFVRMVKKDYFKYGTFNPSVVLRSNQGKEKGASQDSVYYFIGAYLEDLNTESEKSVSGVGDLKGVFVNRVEEFSEAIGLGLLSGDAILSVNGEDVTNTEVFLEMISKRSGQMVELHVIGATDRKLKLQVPANYK